MAAPKGNQYAVGNSGQKPWIYTEEHLANIAKELDEWSKLETSTSLYQFTHDKDYLATDLSEFAQKSNVFKEALKRAKERIGIHREQGVMKGTMNYGVWARSAGMYDSLTHAFEESVKDAELERKKALIDHEVKTKSSTGQISPEQLQAVANLVNQLNSLQQPKKEQQD